MSDAVLAAEGGHRANAAHGKVGLHRTGLVVQARVEHARVVGALVLSELEFLLEHGHGALRPCAQQCTRGRQADEASTDYNNRHCHPERAALRLRMTTPPRIYFMPPHEAPTGVATP